jgi:hypothetical protein
MADTHRDPEPEAQAADRDRGAAEGMPRWVKVSLIVGLVLVLLFVVANVIGVGGEHGPGRHGGDDGTPSTVVGGNGGHRPVDHGP